MKSCNSSILWLANYQDSATQLMPCKNPKTRDSFHPVRAGSGGLVWRTNLDSPILCHWIHFTLDPSLSQPRFTSGTGHIDIPLTGLLVYLWSPWLQWKHYINLYSIQSRKDSIMKRPSWPLLVSPKRPQVNKTGYIVAELRTTEISFRDRLNMIWRDMISTTCDMTSTIRVPIGARTISATACLHLQIATLRCEIMVLILSSIFLFPSGINALHLFSNKCALY